MIAAALLSTLIGVALGLLGGGGSILAVPILVFAVGLPVPTAIATSLLVVGVTSAAAMVPKARQGAVHVRIGLTFGGAGMLGAYFGGRFAALLAPGVLLAGFAAVMAATGVAMLRPRSAPAPRQTGGSSLKIPLLGGAIGIVTGLIGAGGGFLIVPALVLFGGLGMADAIGTSLLVIALQSFAGFVGYAGHVTVPWAIAGVAVSAALAGALVGQMLAARLPATTLRRLFGGFVLLMALFVVAHQLPSVVRNSAVFRVLFVERWPFWASGAAIAAVAGALLYFDNRMLGVTTGCAELCGSLRNPSLRSSWRLRFLAGIVLGGMIAAMVASRAPSFDAGLQTLGLRVSSWQQALLLLGGGVLIGAGARLAGGCTSGHGIVGVAQGARSSILVTITFLASGFLTNWLLSL